MAWIACHCEGDELKNGSSELFDGSVGVLCHFVGVGVLFLKERTFLVKFEIN